MKKTILSAIIATFAFTSTNAQLPVYQDESKPLEQRIDDALSRMTTHEKVQLCHANGKFFSSGVPRLGIPGLMHSDGPHGVRMEIEWNTWNHAGWTIDSIVAFPSLQCLAATWNTELAHKYGNAVGEEFAYRGKNIMLGPGVNIYRQPYCGRNFEYMGEDPHLASRIAVEYIKGAQKNGVACCLKHFFLNNQEKNRFNVDVTVSERAIREIYLPAFEACVKEADVWTVMGAYNYWLGKHCCHNDSLLNGLLKRGMGFKGAVVSDWGGVTETMGAALGGLDIEMGTGTDGFTAAGTSEYDNYHLGNAFEQKINNGEIPMSVLNDKARRVLRTIFHTSYNRNRSFGNICTKEHYDICRQVGAEGIVLLKNNGILPLDINKYKNVLVVGENATRSLTEGGGSSELKPQREVSPLEAIRKIFNNVEYAQGFYSGRAMFDHIDKLDEDSLAKMRQEAYDKAANADLVIYVGGMNKNTYEDCENNDRQNYNLSFGQDELIEGLQQRCKNVVCIMFSGNAYAMPWLNKTSALLQSWYLGSESGNAICDILTGKENPSGKLPITINKRAEDYPAIGFGEESYPGIDNKAEYKEGILVGYRWNDTKKVAPLFPFGYGLSYTTFRYGKAKLSGNTVSIDVTNTGKVAGKEIVQLYVGEDKPKVERPQKELKHFQKIALEPGETKSVSFTISPDDLRYWNDSTHSWQVDKGKYTIYIGSSSRDIKATVSTQL